MGEERRQRGTRYEEMVEHAPYFREAIFRTVFSEPEQLLELFQSIAPQQAEGLTADDVQKLSITSVPSWCYDCIAFTAGDHIVIVQDAGLEVSKDRLSNGAFYIAAAITAYADSKKIDLYGDEPAHIPDPETYVLYAAEEDDPIKDGQIIPCTIESSLGTLSYEPMVKIQGAVKGDITDQYIAAGIVCDEEGDKHDEPDQAAYAIARRCLERGLLPTYFVRDETAAEKD